MQHNSSFWASSDGLLLPFSMALHEIGLCRLRTWRSRKQPTACHPFFAYLADQRKVPILCGHPTAISPWIICHHQLPEFLRMNLRAPAIAPGFTLESLKALLLSRPEDFRPSALGEHRPWPKIASQLGWRRKQQPFFVLLKKDAWARLLDDICRDWSGCCNAVSSNAASIANNSVESPSLEGKPVELLY